MEVRAQRMTLAAVRREFTDTGFQLRSGPWLDNPVVRGMTARTGAAESSSPTRWGKNRSPLPARSILAPPIPTATRATAPSMAPQ